METSQLAGLKPTLATVRALVDLLVAEQGRRFKLIHEIGTAITDKAERKSWFGWHGDDWAAFLAESDHSQRIKSALSSITRGGRTRTGSQTKPHETRTFTALSAEDLEACTLSFDAWEAGVRSLEIDFTPWVTSIRLHSSEFDDDRLGPYLTVEAVEAALLSSTEPWQQPLQSFEPPPFRVFMGHGGDPQWRDLRDALRDHHGFDVEAFERVTRVGQTISEIVRGMIFSSTVGVLVLTRSDKQDDGTWHGRQNVIHELGFVQGALGWDRAVIVVEEGVVLPSNLDGTQQVRFREGHIREAEGEVAAHLRQMRERPVGVCL